MQYDLISRGPVDQWTRISERASRVAVAFTRNGFRQFLRLNERLGSAFLRGAAMRAELARYIAGHEASGVMLDSECQEVRYEAGVYLLLRKVQGIWYITEVFETGEAGHFEPVYYWERLRRGCGYVLAQLLACWRRITNQPGSFLRTDQAGKQWEVRI